MVPSLVVAFSSRGRVQKSRFCQGHGSSMEQGKDIGVVGVFNEDPWLITWVPQ